MATPETFLTLGQAAKATGKGKGTLSKAVKSGKLSVAHKEGNQYKIDPAELFRVFPYPQQGEQETKKNVSSEQMETPSETSRNAILEVELRLTQQMLRKEEAAHAETKSEKLRLLDTLESQTRLLTHITAETAAQKQNKKGFLGWLTSKK